MENCPVSEIKLFFHNGDIKLVNTANIQITYSYDLLKVRNREYCKEWTNSDTDLIHPFGNCISRETFKPRFIIINGQSSFSS